jgi:Zn-dependent metalloprotease
MRRFVVLGVALALIGSFSLAIEKRGPLAQSNDDGVAATFQQIRSVNVDGNGVPTFIVGKLGFVGKGDIVGESFHYLQGIRHVFQAAGDEDFAPISATVDPQGYSHAKFQQYINGLPVVGAEMVVHTNTRTGEVVVVNGQFIRDEDLPRHAEMDAVSAFEIAAAEAGIKEGRVLDQPTLTYVADNGKGYLAYTARIAYTYNGMEMVDQLFADARTGEMVAKHAKVYQAMNRKVYNGNHTDPNNPTLPGTLMISEGGSSTDVNAQDVYTNFGYTYNYFKNTYGRDSIDNAGMTLIGTTHVGTNWVNAYWNGTQMVFGDGDGTNASYLSHALDVVAHELTHGITERTANLTYSKDSGALNEGMSDIFGNTVEAYRDGAVSANTWLVGEAVWTPATSGDALRYMNNPTQDGYSTDYYPERLYASGCTPSNSNDQCGVHGNSGIANLSYYLLVQGGTHPRGKTTTVVTGIGITKAAAIYFRALTTGLFVSSTTYPQAATACKTAAEQLYGVGSAEATQTTNAWAAVGVGAVAPPTTTVLTNNVALASQSGTAGAYVNYKITVPSGQTSLVVTTTGGTGDCDLYVKNGSAATSSNYDGSSAGSTTAETVTITNPAAADYYIGLYGYAAYSGVTIKAVYSGTTPTPEFTLAASPTSVTVTQGASGTSTMTTTVSGGFNSAVALTATGAPTGATVTFAPTSIAAPGSGTSTMTINSGTAAAGTSTITITGTGGGKTHTATVSLTINPTGGGVGTLSNGVAVTIAGATGAWVNYKSTVPASQASLAIVMSGGTGDGDMYVKRGAQPTSTVYDYRPYLSGNNESVTVSSPAAGDWYISVYGYAAFASVSLKATYTAGGGGSTTETESNNTTATANTISNGVAMTGYVSSASDVDYFKLSLPAGTITVDLTVPSTKDYDLKLYSSNGTTQIGSGTNGSGVAEHITYTNATAQTVYIKVYGYSGAYSTTLPYTLKAAW